MKRLLIILYQDFPWYSGLSDRVLGIARQLTKHVSRVKVLAPLVYGYKTTGLDVERVTLGEIAHKFKFRRVISFLRWIYYQFRCFTKILKSAKDIAAIQFEHYYVFPLAYIVKILLRKPIIADDINLLHIRPFPPFIRKVFYIIERLVLEKSTLVTTASPITYIFVKKFLPKTRILYLPNAIDRTLKRRELTRNKWIVFVGNLSFGQNLEAVKNIFIIIEKLIKKRKDFRVMIIGSSAERAKNS